MEAPYDYAIGETARFIALVRERDPGMRIAIPIADRYWWIDNLNRKLREKRRRRHLPFSLIYWPSHLPS